MAKKTKKPDADPPVAPRNSWPDPRTTRVGDRFIRITGVGDRLYALDLTGRVWRYVPEDKSTNRYAFWSALTEHRASPKPGPRLRLAGRPDGKE